MKSVCSHLYVDKISDEQKHLSGNGEKDIGKYHPALTSVFESLTNQQVKKCEDCAAEWNTSPLPDHVQLK
jgi:hypothetical protein